MTWKARIDRPLYSGALEIYVANVDEHSDRVTILKGPAIFEQRERFDAGPDQPFLRFPHLPEGRDFLQALVDEAWEIGIRPKGIKDFESANTAQKEHLKDMRAIAAKACGVELP